MKTNLLLVAVLVLARFSTAAAPLTQSTYTEIIRSVNTLATDGNPAAAKANDLLKAPQRVRTGPESRAELTAPDNTITRVGANTVFSFSDSGRTVNLDEGSILFHAPKGVGGGVIKSGGASAAVLGTTLLVSATKDGGFRVIVLEGKAKITLANGKTVSLNAGQEFCLQPGSHGVFAVCEINLDQLVSGSLLVNGFSRPLPSLPLVLAAVQKQKGAIASSGGSKPGSPGYSPLAWSPGLNNIAVPQQSAQPVITTTFVTTFVGNFITLFGQLPGPPAISVPLYNGLAANYAGPIANGAPAYFSSGNPYVVGTSGVNGTAQATAPNGSLTPLTVSSPTTAPPGTVFPNLEIAYPVFTQTPVTKVTYPSTPSRGLILIY